MKMFRRPKSQKPKKAMQPKIGFKGKRSLSGLDPRIQKWVLSGRIYRGTGFMIQNLLTFGILGRDNFELLLRQTRLQPHTIGSWARRILEGSANPGELIRTGVRGKTVTVPKGEIQYVLKQKKGYFGSALATLRKRNPEMPDTLWFNLIRKRVLENAKDKGLKTLVLRLCKDRFDLVHEMHELSMRESNGDIQRRIFAIFEELRATKQEMAEIATYL